MYILHGCVCSQIYAYLRGCIAISLAKAYAKQKHLGWKKGKAKQKQQLSNYTCDYS